MSAKTEGKNPFDRYLPPEKKQEADRLWAARNFEEVQAEVERATREASELADLHGEQWARYQERQHDERLQEAEESVPVEVRQELQMDQAEQDRLDDQRFGWITYYDQLLQLGSHEDYLRARRSLDRRLKHARETGKSLPRPWSAGRVWVVGTLVGAAGLALSAMAADPVGGFIVACIIFPIWAVLAKAPSFFQGFGGGQYGRGGGNAV